MTSASELRHLSKMRAFCPHRQPDVKTSLRNLAGVIRRAPALFYRNSSAGVAVLPARDITAQVSFSSQSPLLRAGDGE